MKLSTAVNHVNVLNIHYWSISIPHSWYLICYFKHIRMFNESNF